jgi:hypothetical protein
MIDSRSSWMAGFQGDMIILDRMVNEMDVDIWYQE